VSRRWWPRLVGPAAGVAVIGVALAPPLHGAAHALFTAHMVQHLLLVAVAAPLLSLGTPGLGLLAALPRRTRVWLARRRPRLVPTMPGRLAVPAALGAWLLHVAVLWAWHTPRLYDWAVQSPVLHAAEHASLLVTAWAFWAVVLHPRGRRALGIGGSLLYLFAAAGQCAALGALLTLGETPWYATHAATAGTWGLTPLEDQQLAGLIMWLPGGMVYATVALARLAATLNVGNGAATAITLAMSLALAACGQATPPEQVVPGGDAARGRRAVAAYGCGACHVVPGVPGARGRVGPSLADLADRPYLAGRLVNDATNLVTWVRHPRRIDPGTLMPDLAVTEADARDIAAFLYARSRS
jgi:putative membrane protein